MGNFFSGANFVAVCCPDRCSQFSCPVWCPQFCDCCGPRNQYQPIDGDVTDTDAYDDVDTVFDALHLPENYERAMRKTIVDTRRCTATYRINVTSTQYNNNHVSRICMPIEAYAEICYGKKQIRAYRRRSNKRKLALDLAASYHKLMTSSDVMHATGVVLFTADDEFGLFKAVLYDAIMWSRYQYDSSSDHLLSILTNVREMFSHRNEVRLDKRFLFLQCRSAKISNACLIAEQSVLMLFRLIESIKQKYLSGTGTAHRLLRERFMGFDAIYIDALKILMTMKALQLFDEEKRSHSLKSNWVQQYVEGLDNENMYRILMNRPTSQSFDLFFDNHIRYWLPRDHPGLDETEETNELDASGTWNLQQETRTSSGGAASATRESGENSSTCNDTAGASHMQPQPSTSTGRRGSDDSNRSRRRSSADSSRAETFVLEYEDKCLMGFVLNLVIKEYNLYETPGDVTEHVYEWKAGCQNVTQVVIERPGMYSLPISMIGQYKVMRKP